jgi:hypothetical protein
MPAMTESEILGWYTVAEVGYVKEVETKSWDEVEKELREKECKIAGVKRRHFQVGEEDRHQTVNAAFLAAGTQIRSRALEDWKRAQAAQDTNSIEPNATSCSSLPDGSTMSENASVVNTVPNSTYNTAA